MSIPLWQYLGIPQVLGGAELAVFCAAIVGAGIAFLWFNTYPASVFMGDIGSLALGGALGGLAVLTQERGRLGDHPRRLPGRDAVGDDPGGLVQDDRHSASSGWRRSTTTSSSRGWREPKIIVRFWIVSILCGGVALLSLKLR